MQMLNPATLKAVRSLSGQVTLGQVPVANAFIRIFGIELNRNNLAALPVEVTRISSLPNSVLGLPKLAVVGIEGNRLCVVSSTMQAWLDKLAIPWKPSQIWP